MTSRSELWIFGYGSLVWRPEFPHVEASRAWIRGHVRRFWQGSTDHRGLPGRPGRVVTLVPEDHPDLVREPASDPSVPAVDDVRCWGTAYRVAPGEEATVLARLDHRERGGYVRLRLELTLDAPARAPRVVEGLVYVAGPDNENYLGPASFEAIARQVAQARGPSGANDEYVLALAGALRGMGVRDAHVFALETALIRLRPEPAGREPG